MIWNVPEHVCLWVNRYILLSLYPKPDTLTAVDVYLEKALIFLLSYTSGVPRWEDRSSVYLARVSEPTINRMSTEQWKT